MSKKKIPEIANDNQPEIATEAPEIKNQPEALDFSADNTTDWDSDTSHLDEIAEEDNSDPVDDKTGLKTSEMLSEDEFFTNFFSQNLALAEAMTGMVGLSVDVSSGEPELGARETSNLLYGQCKKFRFLAWALKKQSDLQNIFAIAMFVQGKSRVVAAHFGSVPEPDEPAAANDNNEPLEKTA